MSHQMVMELFFNGLAAQTESKDYLILPLKVIHRCTKLTFWRQSVRKQERRIRIELLFTETTDGVHPFILALKYPTGTGAGKDRH